MNINVLTDLLAQQKKLTNDLMIAKDDLRAQERHLASEGMRGLKIEHELRNANAELMKMRGRLEPRTAIEFCERGKLRAMNIKVDNSTRTGMWRDVWNHASFEEFRSIAAEAPAIKVAERMDVQFGAIVTSICNTQNSTIHSIMGTSVVIPREFSPDQQRVMKAICDFIPVDHVIEQKLGGSIDSA